MTYTSLPIIIYALYDKEYKGRDFLTNPEYYSIGLKNLYFTKRIFWLWIVFGVWQAFIVCFATYYIFTCITSENHSLDFWADGMTVFGTVILIANIKILLFSNTYSLLSVTIIVLSVLFYYSNYVIESFFFVTVDQYDSFERYLLITLKVYVIYIFFIGLSILIISISICFSLWA